MFSDKYRHCPLANNNATWKYPIHGAYLSGTNPITLTKATLDECKNACLQRTDFHCMSLDYDHSADGCRLKVLNE